MIRNLVFDCDGVLTDGTCYYSKEGAELKAFNSNDSAAVIIAREKGIRCILISSASKKSREIHETRAKTIDIECYYTPFNTKHEFLKILDIDFDETAYIGDCLDDMLVFDLVKLSFAPSSALDVVRNYADVVLKRGGGEGCLLEALLYLDRFNGRFN